MSALALAGTPQSPNHVLRLETNNLYPFLRRGDFVLWQPSGFVADGLHVCDVNGHPNVYLVQHVGGAKFSLFVPDRDHDPKTGKVKPNATPQVVDRETFDKICAGAVIAELKVTHAEALFGGRLPQRGRKVRELEAV